MSDKWETDVSQLRIVGGIRQDPPKNMGVEERRPLLPIRSRGKGKLFVIVELTGEAFGRDEMCQDLVRDIVEEYFDTAGTVTYGLRQAILLANTQLLRANARITSEHRVGGVACVVLRSGEMFVAQAGWPMVYLVRQQTVQAFPDTTLDFEDTTMLGQRQTAEVRLFNTSVRPGDMVLLADGPMSRQLGTTRIGQILAGSIGRATKNLETLAPSEDSSAMVIQIGPSQVDAQVEQGQWAAFTPVEQPEDVYEEPEPVPSISPPVSEPSTTVAGAPGRTQREMSRTPELEPVPRRADSVEPSYPPTVPRRQQVEYEAPPARASTTVAQASTPTRRHAREGVPIGDRAQEALSTIGQGMRALGERILPDRQPASPSRRRRTATRRRRGRGQAEGQPKFGLAAAIAIPIVALLIVGGYLLYRDWAVRSRFEEKLEAAMVRRDIAIGNADTPIQAREDWLQVIALANEADEIQLGDPTAQQLRAQAAIEIDLIDGVTRLNQVVQLYEYAVPGSRPGRVVVAGLDVYVLDRGTGQVYKHTLNEVRNAIANAQADPVLIKETQLIEGQNVGMLVDIAWIKDGGDRQAGALLILDRNALLVEHDPAWEQLSITTLGGRDVWRDPVSLQTFDGNLYILDVMANQIFKYAAQQYTAAPQSWLTADVDLATAVDMGIDGSIFVLHSTGKLDNYFAGETVPFAFSRMPQPLYSANGMYLDVEEAAQYIYIADQTESRIVQFDREGAFVRQLRPSPNIEASFEELVDVFADETAGKIFYTASNGLYVADLPPVQP
jgi:hypothetical protein